MPVSSSDAPFVFKEITADYQEVTIQGQVTYRITDPKLVAQLLNFTLNAKGTGHISDDPQKIAPRIISTINVLVRSELGKLNLRDAITASQSITESVLAELKKSPQIAALGLEILSLAIIGIRPNPETSRALESDTREKLLKEADNARYSRRNAAVEQERSIKENELNTEIAIENKKRQIRETQMDAEKAVKEKEHALEQLIIGARINAESENKKLVALRTENARTIADSRVYEVQTMMQAFAHADPREKERKKSGQPGARKRFQFSKR